ncbi:hybrid sensor histidine kinase/response regulator [Noviherbaspirillum sp.]|uniref:hybrid sensor histidine kinase/response regulator n=1 Tax=Noviherbaspirillum sp. TaxID=1926288 RepID=UPI002FE37C7D
MHIRSRLLLLVLAVLIPSFIAAALGIGYVYKEAIESQHENMRETTRAWALLLDKEFAKREAILQVLALSPALQSRDIKTFYAQAKAVASGQENVIVLSDTDGQQLLNTRLSPDATGLPKSLSHAELRSRYGPDATIMSNLYLAPIGKRHSFSVQVPVTIDGRIVYYLAMGSFASQLQSVFEGQNMPADWHGSILDRNGVVVARSKEPGIYVGKRVQDDFVRKLADNSGFYEGVSLHGAPSIGYFSRAPSSEWTFVVAVPKASIQRTVVNATAAVGALALLLLGLAVLGALAVGRAIASPMEGLRRAAERLGRGEPVAPATSGIVEMDAVNAAMVQAGAEIDNAKRELEQRVAEAVAVAERSQRALLQAQKLEALGRLTGGIAHDFNNVLQTLSTGLQVVLLSSSDARVTSTLQACQRAVERAAELTRQLMVFGRVQDARLETVDLSQQIGAMEPMLKGGLRGDIDLRIDVAENIWPVTLDPLQFELALLNLAINARDAMPGGGTLLLEARNDILAGGELPPGDYVRLSLKDSGVGMGQDVLAHAVDPFFTTKAVGKGSGMGLPQAYGFARQAGGTLVLHGEPGRGTTVVIYLPRATQAVARPRADDGTAPAEASSGKVLFVEDDPMVMDVVLPALEGAGFSVVAVRNGEEALAFLDAGARFDLVFSDIIMPGAVGGIDLARIVQSRWPHIRVVLATGYSDRRVDLPDVRVLAKPYGVGELLAALNDALRTTGREA